MGYMKLALALAELSLGYVSPNPAVGAVIVKDGVVVGQGFTQPPGSAHAEIIALRQAGELSRGSTMYVTLEPCGHYGRTPPCTKSIIEAGISEVHFSIIDPNPVVSGKGKKILEESGVKTCVGECAQNAAELNEAFVKHITTGLPFITAKFAMSIDGKIATKTGDSRWISGEASRQQVQRLRYVTDAVMVGVNTVIADDPRLTFRFIEPGGIIKKQPLRIIVDSDFRTPKNAKLLSEPGKTLIAMGRKSTAQELKHFDRPDVELLEIDSSEGLVNMQELLIKLGQRQIMSILVEGGGTLLGSLFDMQLVDKVVAFIAPIVIGGKEAKSPIMGGGIEKMSDALRLKRVRVDSIEDDIMVTGYLRELKCLPA